MKRVSVVILIFLFSACRQKDSDLTVSTNTLQTPDIFIQNNNSGLTVKGDSVFYQSEAFSGYISELDSTSNDTVAISTFSKGLLNGVSKKWYPNGQLMEERGYLDGEKNGLQLLYWENGNKRVEFTALKDAYEGELKEYNQNGFLFHLGTYKNGQEEGTQKMWYDNGKIRANYVIKNGKRYGLLGTKNCKNASDSIFVVQ